jgi:hypothetical protein
MLKVLVVDDDPDICLLTRRLVTTLGCESFEAKNGFEAEEPRHGAAGYHDADSGRLRNLQAAAGPGIHRASRIDQRSTRTDREDQIAESRSQRLYPEADHPTSADPAY